MQTAPTILTFIAWFFVFMLCVFVTVAGVQLVVSSRATEDGSEEGAVEYGPLKVIFKLSGGALLTVAGLAGAVIVVYHYWQVLLGLLVLAGAGGAKISRKGKPKKKGPVKERGPKKKRGLR